MICPLQLHMLCARSVLEMTGYACHHVVKGTCLGAMCCMQPVQNVTCVIVFPAILCSAGPWLW